jgi:hypothetical protein
MTTKIKLQIFRMCIKFDSCHNVLDVNEDSGICKAFQKSNITYQPTLYAIHYK